MFNILKNIICLLLIHIAANTGSYVFSLGVMLLIFVPFLDEITTSFSDFSIILLILFIFGRLLVLPIAYKSLENSQNFELVSKFIQKLKQSFHLKMIVLIAAYFSFWSLGFPYFEDGFYVQFYQGLLLGLLGSYIVLFVYWFIEDKARNTQ